MSEPHQKKLQKYEQKINFNSIKINSILKCAQVLIQCKSRMIANTYILPQ